MDGEAFLTRESLPLWLEWDAKRVRRQKRVRFWYGVATMALFCVFFWCMFCIAYIAIPVDSLQV